MADPFDEVVMFFSRTFGMPTDFFTWPYILFYFIVPLIGLIYLWYTFLNKRLRIFRASSAANFGLAVMFSFVTCPLIIVNPTFILAGCIGASILVMGRFTFWRIVASFAAMALIGFVFPLLTTLALESMGVSPLTF